MCDGLTWRDWFLQMLTGPLGAITVAILVLLIVVFSLKARK